MHCWFFAARIILQAFSQSASSRISGPQYSRHFSLPCSAMQQIIRNSRMAVELPDWFTLPVLLQLNSEEELPVQLLDLYWLHLNTTDRMLLPYREQFRASLC